MNKAIKANQAMLQNLVMESSEVIPKPTRIQTDPKPICPAVNNNTWIVNITDMLFRLGFDIITIIKKL